jgi:predicted DNA-binding protein (MmcQ/YjbR family)
MDIESTRTFLRKLPHVVETEQFGGAHLCYWVGDRLLGGKSFAVLKVEGIHTNVLAFYAGAELFSALLEHEGLVPAPYMAHLKWVALTAWNSPAGDHLPELLRQAHTLIANKLPLRTRAILAMPSAERKALLVERRQAQSTKKDVTAQAKLMRVSYP